MYKTDEGKEYLTLLEDKLGEFSIPTITKLDFDGGTVECEFDCFDGRGWRQGSTGEIEFDGLFDY